MARRKHKQPKDSDQAQPGDQLCRAAIQGDLATVQQLLSSGIDPNAPASRYNWSALLLAEKLEIVDALLKAGADIHRQDESGSDALAHALDHGDQALVDRLVQAGADLNRRNQFGWTRLRTAAFGRNPDGVALLLKAGADPQLDRGKLLSAASWYASEGYHEPTERTIDLLVAAGEEVNATDPHGYSALHCAVHGDAHTPSVERWWNASSDGSDETATRALLKHGANPNAAGSNGMTPLLLAVRSTLWGEPCVAALLTAGADAEQPGNGGITPLMRAAYHRQVESLCLLLAHGVDPRRIDRYGHDALYYARQALANVASEEDEEDPAPASNEDAQMRAWQQEFIQEQQANAQHSIALLEAALHG